MKNITLLLTLPLLSLAVSSCVAIPSAPPVVANNPTPLSTSSYKEFIPVGKDVPLRLSSESSVEKWITLVAGDKVLVTVDDENISMAVVDNTGFSVVGEDRRLIQNVTSGTVFTAPANGIYGIILTNPDNSPIAFTLTTQKIIR